MIARCFVDVHWPHCRVELPPMEWIYFVENMNMDLVGFCHYLSAKTAEGLDYPSKFSLRLQLY